MTPEERAKYILEKINRPMSLRLEDNEQIIAEAIRAAEADAKWLGYDEAQNECFRLAEVFEGHSEGFEAGRYDGAMCCGNAIGVRILKQVADD